jgi:hypothetical protein
LLATVGLIVGGGWFLLLRYTLEFLYDALTLRENHNYFKEECEHLFKMKKKGF